jgi:hypothetical protein
VLALRCLYRAIAKVSGADIVVDSSKQTAYGALARFATDQPPVFVHLIRDPRAVAHSWQRLTPATPSGTRVMPRHGAAGSSFNWVLQNLGAGVLRAQAGEAGLLLRYEDFVRAPRSGFSRLAVKLQRKELGALFVDEQTVDLPLNHTFAGNPSRFRHGLVTLTNDQEWIPRQSRMSRLVCDVITLPMLLLYGYEIRVRGAHHP